MDPRRGPGWREGGAAPDSRGGADRPGGRGQRSLRSRRRPALGRRGRGDARRGCRPGRPGDGVCCATRPSPGRLIAAHGPEAIVAALDVRDGQALGDGWTPAPTARDVDRAWPALADAGVVRSSSRRSRGMARSAAPTSTCSGARRRSTGGPSSRRAGSPRSPTWRPCAPSAAKARSWAGRSTKASSTSRRRSAPLGSPPA